jgi:hypothetical protein
MREWVLLGLIVAACWWMLRDILPVKRDFGPPGATKRELLQNWGAPDVILEAGFHPGTGYYQFVAEPPRVTYRAYCYQVSALSLWLIYLDAEGRVAGVYHGET